MSAKEVTIDGTTFQLVLTDQIISHVNNLKNLYNSAYEDPESFEMVSSEISSTINEIADLVEPRAGDGELDGLIQEVIRIVDDKASAIEKELHEKPEKKIKKATKKKSKSKK